MIMSVNCKPNIITSGDKSIPDITTNGSFLRTKANTGSVKRVSTCTIGLYGSGRTKLKNEAIIIMKI